MPPNDTQGTEGTTIDSSEAMLTEAVAAAAAFVGFQEVINDVIQSLNAGEELLQLQGRIGLAEQDILSLRQRVDSMQGNVGADNPTFQDRSRKGQIEENT